MKIDTYTTANALDPNETTENPQASLSAYNAEIEREILKAYPNAEIKHHDEDNTYSFRVNGVDDYKSQLEIEDEIQQILESVYETGNFWS